MPDANIADHGADPEVLFAARLTEPTQRLVRPDGSPWNRNVARLYLDGSVSQPGRCLVCLRAFDATPKPRAVRSRYCSPQCRTRFGDPKRRQPRAWRQCAECGADFLCLDLSGYGGDGLWTCPLPAPASYWARGAGERSECALRRARELDRQAHQRLRDNRRKAGLVEVRRWVRAASAGAPIGAPAAVSA